MTCLKDIAKNKGHSILYWNARSLYPRLEEVERIIDSSKTELFGIVETWLNSNTTNQEINFDKYLMYRADRTAESRKKGGGGLVFYYKEGLKVIHLTEFQTCNPDLECIWLQLQLVNTKKINFGLIYRPPSGNVINFLNHIEDICLTMRQQYNCEINFGGDININLSKRDINVRRYNDCLKRMGFKQTITNITHISDNGNSKGVLDHFVTSEPDLYAHTGVIVHGATDHFIIFGTRKKAKIDHPKDDYRGRAYGKMDKDKFKYDIITHNGDNVYNSNDPEIAWGIFKKDFVSILDKHAPYKSFYSRRDRQPWVTTEYLEGANERDNKLAQSETSNNPQDRIEYKRIRNRVVGLKRDLKRLFFQRSIEDSYGDSSKLWKALKHFLNNSKISNKITCINGKTDAEGIANEINDYFIDIGSNLSDKIPNSTLELNLDKNLNYTELQLQLTTVEEIEKQLKKIPDSKATGDDGIPIRFIKLTSLITAKIICHIVNLTITTNIIPADWKSATITPLFKQGEREDPSNYRPISILPALSKVLE